MFLSPMGTHGEIDEFYSGIPTIIFTGKMGEKG